ncbi:predicted protein [Verticillium alfalfae VaMs.102]|uniref:Predicted protein n=1 Tax=Verticillium alfalfae (strain VaMs.102 / ATCC MYA-4576 / FGSC 10136) TaxID=526221 RepID=C9SI88_VERA1|nr:predicted protein [Verticillium alfalfae VaMs.102]EEY18661.1 predicted protein [Verticillium alfalfae VaMs.102]
MSSDEQTKICLGVAVDHRIQRLCKTTPHGLAGESDHVASIKEEGRALKRPREEVAVTAELAGPAYKGGIAVMLQQPRKTHPYDKGIDAVIEDCESLLALYEVFDVASRGSLDIRTNVSVVDLLPFDMYSDTLLDLKVGITSLLANPDMAKESPEKPYRVLLESGLSETCNDLALILTQISRCVERGWPESVAWKNEASLRALSSDTLLLSEMVLKAAKKAERTGFAEIAVVGMKIIARIDKKGRDKDAAYKYGMDPNELRKNFTKMAMHIESLLLDLLEKKEDALNALGQEDYLSSLMDKVSITPSSTRNEYRRSPGAVRSGW